MIHPAARVLVVLIVLLSADARAQTPAPALIGAEPVEAPWVQVEVLLFRHLDATLVAGETWPLPRGLAYPEPLQILVEPGSPAHEAALATREFDTLLAAEEGSATTPPVLPAELPYLRLSGADTMLGASATRIGGAAAYRLLGHLAWRQPLPESGRKVHVLITAGNKTGTHYEAEGFIGLSRARYLHAQAKLWLNEFPATSGEGVELPVVPLPQVPHAESALQEPAATDAMGAAQAALGLAAGTGQESLVIEPERAARTVLFDVSRRLVPGEYQYLDHPLFGAILAVRPWDPIAGATTDDTAAPAQPPEGAEETPPPP